MCYVFIISRLLASDWESLVNYIPRTDSEFASMFCARSMGLSNRQCDQLCYFGNGKLDLKCACRFGYKEYLKVRGPSHEQIGKKLDVHVQSLALCVCMPRQIIYLLMTSHKQRYMFVRQRTSKNVITCNIVILFHLSQRIVIWSTIILLKLLIYELLLICASCCCTLNCTTK